MSTEAIAQAVVAADSTRGEDPDIQKEENILNEKIVNEEYKIWKKQAPFLYDFLLTRALRWPSLTVEWLPDTRHTQLSQGFASHRLLLGTHTSRNETDYISISDVDLPNPDFSAPTGAVDNSKIKKIDVDFGIVHENEVNRARASPVSPNLIASSTASGNVLVFDSSDQKLHDAWKDNNRNVRPLHTLKQHTSDVWGLSWSYENATTLVSSSDDSTIALWDLAADSKDGQLAPVSVLTNHSAAVNDVKFSKLMPKVFGSVSDDISLRLWDTRASSATSPGGVLNALTFSDNGHKGPINSLSFNPFVDTLVATGSADSLVHIWDFRATKKPVYTLQGHSADVSAVEWSPFDESVLATASYDRRVNVWDLSLVELDLHDDDQTEGPPELLFVHGGHTNKVLDISWDPVIPWTLASVSEDNVVQVWRIASSVAEKEYEEEIEDQVEEEPEPESEVKPDPKSDEDVKMGEE